MPSVEAPIAGSTEYKARLRDGGMTSRSTLIRNVSRSAAVFGMMKIVQAAEHISASKVNSLLYNRSE